MREMLGETGFLILFTIITGWYCFYLRTNAESIVQKAENDKLLQRLKGSRQETVEEQVQRLRRQSLWILVLSVLFFIGAISQLVPLIGALMK